MKTRTLLSLLCASLLGWSNSYAQEGPEPPPSHEDQGRMHPHGEAHKPGGQSGRHETRMLSHLLKLDDEQLSKLRQTIERIEKMSPEERTALQERIQKMDGMDSEKVDAMRRRFEKIPKETRDAMRQRWLEMTPEERHEWHAKLRGMSPEERQTVLREQGFLPLPPKKRNKGPKNERPPLDEEEPPPHEDDGRAPEDLSGRTAPPPAHEDGMEAGPFDDTIDDK